MTGRKFRVCFWATTFQADILTFARYLGDRPEYEVMVVMEDPNAFKKEGIQLLRPVRARFLDMNSLIPSLIKAKLFRAHVLIVDNHFPPIRLAPRVMMLWHGLGWKGPQDEQEFVHVHNALQRHVGGGKIPNPRLIWQCFGPIDLVQRNQGSGIAKENLMDLGAAFTDDLLHPILSKEDCAPYYPFEVAGIPTVLLALTWHHGSALSHWGKDEVLYREFLDFMDQIGTNVIIRMHDRHRYEDEYIEKMEKLVRGRKNVMIKFKNEHQDNTMDLIVADILISNYSAILTYFYATGKPSIHIHPVKENHDRNAWTSLDEKGLPNSWDRNYGLTLGDEGNGTKNQNRYVWKFPSTMVGGIIVRTMDELKAALRKGLAEPDCCKSSVETFLKHNISGVDGNTCQRIEKSVRSLIQH